MSAIIRSLTDDRPDFSTIAASRRNGWKPSRDPRNWPDDPAMIPQRTRLIDTSQEACMHGVLFKGGFMKLDSWRKAGQIQPRFKRWGI